MLIKTYGIVIKSTKYLESSVICKIYTRQLGMKSYIINGIRSPKAAIKPSLLQALILLDMVVYHNPTKEIHRIKELKAYPILDTLHFDMMKTSVGMFMAELIHKTVKEEEPNEHLFDFLSACIIEIDRAEKVAGLWPLFFMVHYSRLLGFFPGGDNMSAQSVFNLHDGVFIDDASVGVDIIEQPHSNYLMEIVKADFADIGKLAVPKASRIILLGKMIDFYAMHLPEFSTLKSVSVLNSVLRED